MARQRTAEQRLIDNLQRKIRHLNAKENKAKANGDKFDESGFERNKQNIQKMIDDIRKDKDKGKLDQSKLFDYAEKAKNNPNYSTDKKKIRKVSKKLIGANSEELFDDLMTEDGYSDIMSGFSNLSGAYIGESGDEAKRSKALELTEKIKLTAEKDKERLSPEQVTVLNKMAKKIERAYAAKGRKGVVIPLS